MGLEAARRAPARARPTPRWLGARPGALAVAGGRKDLMATLGDIGLFAGLIDGLGLDPVTAARLKRAFLRPGKMAAELARAQADKEFAPRRRLGGRAPGRACQLSPALPRQLEELWTLAGIEPVGGRSAAGGSSTACRSEPRAAPLPRLSAAQAELIIRLLAIEGRPAAALGQAAALAREAGVKLDGLLSEWAERLKVLSEAGVPGSALTLGRRFWPRRSATTTDSCSRCGARRSAPTRPWPPGAATTAS